MTAEAHTAAMQARLDHDALDSVSPFDFDGDDRSEPWPLPEGKPLTAKSDSYSGVWERVLWWPLWWLGRRFHP